MRISRIIINGAVPVVLAGLGYFVADKCCCYCAIAEEGGDMTRYGGVTAFAGISFAANTSLAIRWVKDQFLSFFDGMARKRVARVSSSADDDGAKMLEEKADTLKDRFCDSLRWPSIVYGVLGVVFSVAIAALMFTGIPTRMRLFVVAFPFPAACYYCSAIIYAAVALITFDDEAADMEKRRGRPTDFKTMLGEVTA